MSSEADASATERSSTARWLIELAAVVAAALGIALAIQAFLVKPYRVPSGSMLPTIEIGQRVIVNRLSAPDVGEIVVFHPPSGAESNTCGDRRRQRTKPCDAPTASRASGYYVKRIVAGPGDTVAIRGGHAIVNGRRQPDGFTRPCRDAQDCDFPEPIRVPPGHWFMMGDNRGASDDSRFWGPVPRDWIVGRAVVTYWPPRRIGTL